MKPTLYRRIREILEAARTGMARSVNTAQVVARHAFMSPRYRLRFSVAHEIGHSILHRDIYAA